MNILQVIGGGFVLAAVLATGTARAQTQEPQKLKVYCYDDLFTATCKRIVFAAQNVIGPSAVIIEVVEPERFARERASTQDWIQVIEVRDGIRALVSKKAAFGNPNNKGLLFQVTISRTAFEVRHQFSREAMYQTLYEIRGFLRGWEAAKNSLK